MATIDILLDVDTGVDDALAILFAARHPELNLLGVSCVAGNTHVDQVVRNTLKVLDAAGADDVPVARGASRPLLEPNRDASHVHGKDGMADLGLPESERQPVDVHAIELLRSRIMGNAAPVTLVSLAPMTNLALLLRAYPEVTAKLARIMVMGGSASTGNATAVAEFNVWHDPEAAAIVFGCDAPVTMYGLDVFYGATASAAEIATLSASADPGAVLAGRLLEHALRTAAPTTGSAGIGGAHLGDAGAVCAVAEPRAPAHRTLTPAGRTRQRPDQRPDHRGPAVVARRRGTPRSSPAHRAGQRRARHRRGPLRPAVHPDPARPGEGGMSRQPRVCVVGSLNIDIITHVDSHPTPGETVRGQGLTRLPGGKGANQALAAARSGAKTRLIGRIGDDEAGDAYRRGLSARHVDCSGVVVAHDTPTGTALIAVDEHGENTIIVVPGANEAMDEKAVEVEEHTIRQADVLVLQLEIPMPSVLRVAEIAVGVRYPADREPVAVDAAARSAARRGRPADRQRARGRSSSVRARRSRCASRSARRVPAGATRPRPRLRSMRSTPPARATRSPVRWRRRWPRARTGPRRCRRRRTRVRPRAPGPAPKGGRCRQRYGEVDVRIGILGPLVVHNSAGTAIDITAAGPRQRTRCGRRWRCGADRARADAPIGPLPAMSTDEYVSIVDAVCHADHDGGPRCQVTGSR